MALSRAYGVGIFTAAIAVLASSGVAVAAPTEPSIKVLSNRADLVSGGDALVRVVLPKEVRRSQVSVELGDRDVTQAFHPKGGGLRGLLRGLKRGPNLLKVYLPDRSGASLTIRNHPNGGPVFSGPQLKPWECQEGAVNKKCKQPPEFTYVYQSTDGSKDGLQPYDPDNPASDVAEVTTEGGETVPFIVRVETGYQDRDQYRIATLYEPGERWSARRPQKTFNRKMLVTHGASCNVDYGVGNAPSVTSYDPADLLGLPVGVPATSADSVIYALGQGFVVMSTALDHNGHNCNLVTQAESLVMAKEHVIERYGKLRYTIGTGCSGGSLAQQWIANAYPGIYQGILPTCSFPDTWSSATQVMDYHLLRAYFEDPSNWGSGVVWSPTQFATVEGNLLPVDAIISDIGFFSAIVPTHECGHVTPEQRYEPTTNPGGVRCSISDAAINVFGHRRPSVWSENEVALGHGFAGVPVDNVGVQYGLESLENLEITPGQFADLNAAIGGLDIDINPIPERIKADTPALENAYRSGSINETNNLDRTAVIDCRGPDPGAAHDSYRAYAIRARLDREHGTHESQSIWEGPAPIIGDTHCAQESLIAMDHWLTAVKADKSDAPLAEKVIANKPDDAGDQCWNGTGIKLTDGVCGEVVVPVYGTPRTVAGDAITTDNNKCKLKPLDRGDYALPFLDSEWAKLEAAFPDGVCDFERPGVHQGPTVPWLTYQDARGDVIYGGRRLGPPPRSHVLFRSVID